MKIEKIYKLSNNQIQESDSINFKNSPSEESILNIFSLSKGTFYGFGGAITQSSAYNYSLLNDDEKKKVLELLVGDSGLNYRIFRLCIGSSDFATHSYSYIEDRDYQLDTFDIKEDKKHVIPFIKDLLKYSKHRLYFFASPWTPPYFLKDNKSPYKGGRLLKKYYDLYSQYIIKFILTYKDEGINISALTVQNEPKAMQTWESCCFDVKEEIALAKVISKHLLKNNLDIKLFCWDHNKERLFERANECFKEENLFAGAAFHWYSGEHFSSIQATKAKYPNKLIIESEYCRSTSIDEVDSSYQKEIIGDIFSGTNAIIEWNVLLDSNGGPYHNRKAGCDAPIRLTPNKNVYKGFTYNQTWMFSHFIKEGAEILYTSSFNDLIKISALKNKDNTIIVQILNPLKSMNVNIRFNSQNALIKLEQESLTTLIIK